MTEATFRSYYRAAREAAKQCDAQKALASVQCLLRDLSFSLTGQHSAAYIAETKRSMRRLQQLSEELRTRGVTDEVLAFFAIPKPQKQADAPERIGSQGWCADVFAGNKRAVVEIAAISRSGELSLGTGAIISTNGFLLTNDHIVFDKARRRYCDRITFSFAGEDARYEAKLVCSDHAADLALCRFTPYDVGNFSCVQRISDYRLLQPGADLVLIGNFFGMGLSPINGIVRKVKNANGKLEHSALSNEGDSGGPIFNRSGECVGINCSKTAEVDGCQADGIRNAIPMDTIDRLLSAWSAKYNLPL